MERVRVRYVLTGACLTAYSGRVVHAIVPMYQPDATPTTVGCLIKEFRSSWPADMKELADSIADAPIRVLKTGRVLNEDDIFQQQLSSAEKDTCRVAANEAIGDHTEELQKPSVVMHMVIQKNHPPQKSKAKEKAKSSSNSDGGNSAEGRGMKKNSCCCAM
ncbi:hypothetical protein ABL78_6171 [Leptomonas seymouri]|uniref:UBL3-like ubiquitin domain-containing protein n=1 Tax=Leptomonas seymouri TaxID=5684 RepID=A0A0N1I2H2_LEPSE|nr:hypothetical protein ABL78_6171 [Leptomonas seymouri]|eukprot:KPI84788.1 hypothetical protein ABL78_6171 [Leptomonas seymouri]